MRMSLGTILNRFRKLGRRVQLTARKMFQQVSLAILVGSPSIAWAIPHDLPVADPAGIRESLQVSDGFEWQVESAQKLHFIAGRAGASVSQLPTINLLDLSALTWSAAADSLPSDSQSSQGQSGHKSLSNYLVERTKVDESLEASQFNAAQWHSTHGPHQTYRGLYRNEFLHLAVEPLLDCEHIAVSEPIEIEVEATESKFVLNEKVEYLNSDPLFTKMEPLGPEFFQPLFVIYKLDGREFVVPSSQAKHWNYVPATGQSETANRDISPPSRTDELSEQLQLALASGLENAARKLLELANQIRSKIQTEAAVSQTASTDEDELLK